jgi:hypothetical protein
MLLHMQALVREDLHQPVQVVAEAEAAPVALSEALADQPEQSTQVVTVMLLLLIAAEAAEVQAVLTRVVLIVVHLAVQVAPVGLKFGISLTTRFLYENIITEIR